MSSVVKDHRGQRETVLPVREINLKTCALKVWIILLTQLIWSDCNLNPGTRQ